MPGDRVLRVQRLSPDGDDDGFVLVYVRSHGSHPLDLTLVGTDNEAVFVSSIRQSTVKGLQSSNSTETPATWEAVLSKTLLERKPKLLDPPNDAQAQALDGLECVASVKDDGLTLVWRRRIGRHIQRLGEVPLKPTDDVDLADLFQWTATAAEAARLAHQDVAALESKLEEQAAAAAALAQQVQQLIEAKKEHEEVLLHKFSALLNNKKSKIRDQQRLLATARVDPETAMATGQSRNSGGGEPTSSAGPRKGKRKAGGEASAPLAESDSDGFEDAKMRDEAESDAGQATPEQSAAEETEEEEESGGEVMPTTRPVPSSLTRMRPGSRAKAQRETRSTASGARQTPGESAASSEKDDAPARRELPFTTRPGRSAGEPAKAEDAAGEREEEEEETDDEL